MMMRLLALLLLVAWSPNALGQVQQHSKAELIAETRAPAPGKQLTLAFRMTPDPGWHTYWQNPGDAGFGMSVEWTLPPGVTAGALRYPVPKPLIINEFMNHVYERPHAIIVDFSIDKNVAEGTRLPIRGVGNWLACSESLCLPQTGNFSLDLAAGDGAITATEASRFDGLRAALPQPMDQRSRYAITGQRIEIAIPFARNAAIDGPYFFAATENLFNYAAPQSARRVGDWLVITSAVTAPASSEIDGLLRIGDEQGLLVKAMPGVIPKGGDAIPIYGAKPAGPSMPLATLLLTLGAAILGGLLLNLMPCVFPILGLKALSLAKAGGDERTARRDSIGYSAGVIASCIALGALMLALRAGGEQVGWAFQLQEPRVVLALLLLMTVITANLAGAFELPSLSVGGGLAKQGSFAGSFGTGVLTAIVATPCTGPFMAAALGAALLLPTFPALLLFAGLGLGLALPFLAIAYIPGLRRMMPKSGPWLSRFRIWMAIPMALTALALLWLLWKLSGSLGLAIGGGGAITVLIQLLWMGRTQRRRDGGHLVWRVLVLALFATIFTAIGLLPSQPVAANDSKDVLGSEAFSDAKLNQYRGAGKPVFVYFTADWCVTCKVNEAAAIDREATKEAFARKGIKVLKGDFTRPDPAITKFLAAHGRSGVPLYLFYPKGKEAQILPQLLTPATLEGLQP